MGQQVRLYLRPGRRAAIGRNAIVQRIERLGLATEVIRHDIQADVVEAVLHQVLVDKAVAVRLGSIAA
ncbi:hypothetical protein D9M71_704000 [compost metagenome]